MGKAKRVMKKVSKEEEIVEESNLSLNWAPNWPDRHTLFLQQQFSWQPSQYVENCLRDYTVAIQAIALKNYQRPYQLFGFEHHTIKYLCCPEAPLLITEMELSWLPT